MKSYILFSKYMTFHNPANPNRLPMYFRWFSGEFTGDGSDEWYTVDSLNAAAFADRATADHFRHHYISPLMDCLIIEQPYTERIQSPLNNEL